MTDRLLSEKKTQEIINVCNELCDRTAKVDSKLIRKWFWIFKKRNGLESYRIHGESAAVNDGITSDKTKNMLVELSKYAANDVLNADECAPYYRLPSSTTIDQGSVHLEH